MLGARSFQVPLLIRHRDIPREKPHAKWTTTVRGVTHRNTRIFARFSGNIQGDT